MPLPGIPFLLSSFKCGHWPIIQLSSSFNVSLLYLHILSVHWINLIGCFVFKFRIHLSLFSISKNFSWLSNCKVLIGCDGVQSMVAQWLGLAPPIDSGRSAIRGLSIYQEGHGLKDGIEQFLLCGKRAGFLPLNDKEVYWFITHRTTSLGKLIKLWPSVATFSTCDHKLVADQLSQSRKVAWYIFFKTSTSTIRYAYCLFSAP